MRDARRPDAMDPAAPPLRGRPRDPDLEDRVYDSAILLYAEGGWNSFTMERIVLHGAMGAHG